MHDCVDATNAEALTQRTQAMTLPESATDDRILDSLPDKIRAAILTYAYESGLRENAVIGRRD